MPYVYIRKALLMHFDELQFTGLCLITSTCSAALHAPPPRAFSWAYRWLRHQLLLGRVISFASHKRWTARLRCLHELIVSLLYDKMHSLSPRSLYESQSLHIFISFAWLIIYFIKAFHFINYSYDTLQAICLRSQPSSHACSYFITFHAVYLCLSLTYDILTRASPPYAIYSRRCHRHETLSSMLFDT